MVLDGEPSRREAHLGQLNIALIALAVTCVLIAVTVRPSMLSPFPKAKLSRNGTI
jgi:hypothetical protein